MTLRVAYGNDKSGAQRGVKHDVALVTYIKNPNRAVEEAGHSSAELLGMLEKSMVNSQQLLGVLRAELIG